MDEINYGDGIGGILFEEDVANYLADKHIDFLREYKLQGRGKKWRVDFYIPSLNCIIFCKNLNPKATVYKTYFLSDLCRSIDLLNSKKYNIILLYHDYTTTLTNVFLCNTYQIYLLYSINGLFILSEDGFGSVEHIKEINESYVNLRQRDKKSFISHSRRLEILEYLEYPRKASDIAEKLGTSHSNISGDLRYLLDNDLIIRYRLIYYKKPKRSLDDFYKTSLT